MLRPVVLGLVCLSLSLPAAAAPPEHRRSAGMYIAGTVMTGVGMVATVGGGAAWAVGEHNTDPITKGVGIGVFSLGIAHMVVGVPLMLVGYRRLQWLEKHAVTPAVAVADGAWSASVRLRF